MNHDEEDQAIQRAIEESLKQITSPPIPQPTPTPPSNFSQIQINRQSFQVYPMIKAEYEFTGKIILPQYPFRKDLQAGKAFGTTENPVIFKLSNQKDQKDLYLGLQEFHHDDGRMVFLPYWAIQALNLQIGENVCIENLPEKCLPKARLIKLQPLVSEFVIKVDDPRQVIEDFLNQHMTALSQDQQITIPYQGKEYELYVKELLDENEETIPSADLTNTDVNLEFEAPLDEQSRQIEEEHQTALEAEQIIQDGQKATELLQDHSQTMTVAEQMAAINAHRAADYARRQQEDLPK
jgi:hypothetical protein